MVKIRAIAESKEKPKRYWYENDKGVCEAFRNEGVDWIEMVRDGTREDTPKFKVFRFENVKSLNIK